MAKWIFFFAVKSKTVMVTMPFRSY